MNNIIHYQNITARSDNQSHHSCYTATTTTTSNISEEKENSDIEICKIVSPWLYHYAYKPEDVNLPISLLFNDFLCLHVKNEINLSNWQLNNPIFLIISKICSKLLELNLESAVGLNVKDFLLLRGHLSNLIKLSLKNTLLDINEKCAKIICSFTSLKELDLSNCNIDYKAFYLMAQSCKNVHTLICQDCTGIDDICLSNLVQWIQRFRKLNVIDLSR